MCGLPEKQMENDCKTLKSNTGNSSFRSFVGIGSRRQVEYLEEFTMVLNSMRSIEAKEFRWATRPSEDSASIRVDGRVDPT